MGTLSAHMLRHKKTSVQIYCMDGGRSSKLSIHCRPASVIRYFCLGCCKGCIVGITNPALINGINILRRNFVALLRLSCDRSVAALISFPRKRSNKHSLRPRFSTSWLVTPRSELAPSIPELGPSRPELGPSVPELSPLVTELGSRTL